MACRSRPGKTPRRSIGVPPFDQRHRLGCVIDRVEDAVVPLADPILLLPGQLLHSSIGPRRGDVPHTPQRAHWNPRGTMVDTSPFGEVRMIDLSRVRGALWLAPVALTLTACDATAPKTSQPVSLSVTTKGASGVAVPAGSSMSAAVQIGSGANSLSITQTQVGLARIELSTAGSCAATGEDDDCAELRLGPTVVEDRKSTRL